MTRTNDLPASAQLAGAACGLGAVLYLFSRRLLTFCADRLLSLHLPGASLANPAGLGPAAASLLQLVLSAAALALPFLLLFRFPLKSGLRLGRGRTGRLPALFVLFWICMAGGNLLSMLLSHWAQPRPPFQLTNQSGLLAVAWLTVCLLPAVGEELLFRGLLQGWLREYGSLAAVLGQAVLFSLLHSSLPACAAALLGGIGLGLCAELSGSLRPGILFHLCNNTLAFVMLYAQQFLSPDTEHLLGFLLPVLPLVLALLLLLHRPVGRLRLPKLTGQLSPFWLLRCPGWLICTAMLLIFCLFPTL